MREGNVEGQLCKVLSAFTGSQTVVQTPCLLDDARERCRVRGNTCIRESASTNVCCGGKRGKAGRDQTSRTGYALSYIESFS